MDNHISIAEIKIGEASIKFELPTSLYEAVSKHLKTSNELKLYSDNTEAILEIIRGLIPQEHKPPTHKQESYAKTISKKLGVELPADIFTSMASCSAFLEKYSFEYDLYKMRMAKQREDYKEHRKLKSQATRVNKWLDAKELLEAGVTAEEIAQKYGVKAPTIEKYCNQLSDWVNETSSTESYSIVMSFVEKIRNGEDIYETS